MGCHFLPKEGSSWPKDQTCISCTGRWILYHWATREGLNPTLVWFKSLQVASGALHSDHGALQSDVDIFCNVDSMIAENSFHSHSRWSKKVGLGHLTSEWIKRNWLDERNMIVKGQHMENLKVFPEGWLETILFWMRMWLLRITL